MFVLTKLQLIVKSGAKYQALQLIMNSTVQYLGNTTDC